MGIIACKSISGTTTLMTVRHVMEVCPNELKLDWLQSLLNTVKNVLIITANQENTVLN